ncbi:MAG: DNA-binding protein [Nanoarchaeota archaeon]
MNSQNKLKLQQQVALIEETAKKYLDSEALERFGNIKMVDPEKALQVAALIVQNVEVGNLNDVLGDDQFKEVLIKLQGDKREFKFNRK